MADTGAQETSLVTELIALGRAVISLVRAVKSPVSEATEDEPPWPLALPMPAKNFEDAQLLTQHTRGWNIPSPSRLAAPSYAPAMTAFGIVFIAVGAVTKWPLSVIGAVIFVAAIAKWIGELLHD